MSLFQKKKVLVLFGSPQGHGHTRGLLDAFLEAFSENREWQVQELNLYEESFHPCVGCGACAKQEGCVFSDMDGFDRAFRQCDLLVVASPVYNFSFPAPVKAMLPMAIATSIDALAVGVSFAFLSVNIGAAVSFIGVITFVLSMVGVKAGSLFGAKYKSKAELAGGVILILMGLKILLEHLGVLG